MTIDTKSRAAFGELIELLQEGDQRWCSEERNLATPEDITGSHRALMHIIEMALVGYFEKDARKPNFRRIVTPSRKLTGDNSDAIYFDAPVDPAYRYRIDGEMNQAIYFSMTIERNADGDRIADTCGVINDTQIDIDERGRFTIFLGGEPQVRNWLPLDEGASRITTRHYWEHLEPAAADPFWEPRLKITCISDSAEMGEISKANDDTVSEGIKRVCNIITSRTLNMPTLAGGELPAFMSIMPNAFPKPQKPGDTGLAAADAHYSMAPFFLMPDEAMIITGRWPKCRFANVSLWNRFQQTFDFESRQVSLNRTQTEVNDDGSFKMILAHEDPGLPNWMSTEGNAFGLVFWRFFLVEGDVDTPQVELVKFADLK
jgi:hypothetical protein